MQIIEETVHTIEISDSDASDLETSFIEVPPIKTVNGQSEPISRIVPNKETVNKERATPSDDSAFISDEKLLSPSVDINAISSVTGEAENLAATTFVITSANAAGIKSPAIDDVVMNDEERSPGAANVDDKGISTSVNMDEEGSPGAANVDYKGISTSVNIDTSIVATGSIDLTLPASSSAEQNTILLTANTDESISTPQNAEVQITETHGAQVLLLSIEQGTVSVSSDDTRVNSSNNLEEIILETENVNTVLPSSINDQEMISVIANANNMIPSEKQIEIIPAISNVTHIYPTIEQQIISVTERAAEIESTDVNGVEQTDSPLIKYGVIVKSHSSKQKEQKSCTTLNLEETLPALCNKNLKVLPSSNEQGTISISPNENNVIASDKLPVIFNVNDTTLNNKDAESPHPLNTNTDSNEILPDNINSVIQTPTWTSSSPEDMLHENAEGQFKILREFLLSTTTALSTTLKDERKVEAANSCVRYKEASSKINKSIINQINKVLTQNKPAASSRCSQQKQTQNSDASSSKHVENRENSRNNYAIDNNVSSYSHRSRSSRRKKRRIAEQNRMRDDSNSQRKVSNKRSASRSPPCKKTRSRFDQEETQEELFSIIKDRSQYNGTMSWKQYTTLQSAIVKSIKSNPSDIPPNGVDFAESSYYHKYLSVTCGDLATKKWLYKTVAKLKGLWFGADFEVVDKSILSLIRMRFDLPDDGTSDADILKMLKYQNPKLQTDKWKKISKIEGIGVNKYAYGVDSSSFEALRARDFRTPFGLRRVTFRLIE